MLHRISLNSKQLYAIGLGFESHFAFLEKNIDKYKNQSSFWVYDKKKLDIAYFLANSTEKLSKLTYITRQNYDTIEITKKPLNERTQHQDKVSNILKNNEFKIVRSVMNPHPLSAYVLICRYMGVKQEDWVKKQFVLSFSSQQINIRGSFIPIMNEIRHKYLNCEGLKLRVLDRKAIATPEQYELNIKKWKQHFRIDQIFAKSLYQHNDSEEKSKKEWMGVNKYGWEVESKYILEGFGRKYSSLTFD